MSIYVQGFSQIQESLIEEPSWCFVSLISTWACRRL